MRSLTETAFKLKLPAILGIIAVSLGAILLVGLLCGLVARPANCLKQPDQTSLSSVNPSASTRTSQQQTSSQLSTQTRISTSSATTQTTTPQTTTSTSQNTITTTQPITLTTSTTTPIIQTTTITISTTTATTATTTTASTTTTATTATTATTTTTAITTTPTTTTRTTRPPPESLAKFRLITALSPNRYTLLLRVDHDPYSSVAEIDSPNSLGYTGQVTIEFRVVEATNQIALHMDRAIELTNPNIDVTNNGVPVTVLSQDYDRFQIFRINLTSPLAANSECSLKLEFKSRTTRDGFYYHGYQESNQRERSSLGTRFIPNYARTAFPCFDEPGFKSEFSITIEHSRRSIALSNYPVLTKVDFMDSENKPKTRTTFETTKPISTYSVGWAIVPDDFGKKQSVNVVDLGIELTIYGRASEINQGLGDLALEVAEKTLLYLKSLLEASEALPPKIDLIALPYFPDFSSPSWGLNGFKEYDIFYNDDHNSKVDRQRTALFVAKEMAHNWFGDYFTCEFWDDVWIQEGLAQYFQYQAINDAFPEWDILDQYLVDNTVPAMWRDGYESSLPLKFLIYETVQLKYLFSDLMYKKSASIMKMFASAFGVEDFKNCVKNMLSSTPYGTYNFESFVQHFTLSQALFMPVKDFLEPWIVQRNLPQISLIKKDNSTNTEVTFIQEKFLLVNLDIQIDDSINQWPIYIECKAGGYRDDPLAGGGVEEFRYLLKSASGTLELPRQFNWVKCNKDFNGYYITDYSDDQFNSFETVLLHSRDTFSVADRVNLIHTAFETAWLGTSSYGPASLITIYMSFNEQNLCPWRTLFYHVERLAILTEHRESFRNLRGFVLQGILDAIGNLELDIYVDSEDHLEELLKIEFANQLGRLQSVQALNKFSEMFQNISLVYFIDPENAPIPLSSNLRGLTYKYHMQNTYDLNEWFDLYGFFFVTNEAREKEYTLEAVANTRQTFLYDLILDDLLFDPAHKLPIEAAPILFASMGANPTARYFAWYYVRFYWDDLFKKGANMRAISESLLILTSSFDSILLVDEAALFFLTSNDYETVDIRLRILETGLNNYIWTLDREYDFEKYFFELL